ncbi:MAG: hypothetical protein J7K51_07675 [Thermotogae bacterium]|nr:hypothetical protein [Thermotogota bacterium]
MIWKMFVISVIVLFFTVSFFAEVPFINDVKPSSDIYNYVIKVIEANIMELSNNNFYGSDLVNRYELAKVSTKLIDYVDKKAPTELASLSQRLKNLSTEISLIKRVNVDAITKRIGQNEERTTALEKKMVVFDQLDSVLRSMQSLTGKIPTLNERMNGVEKAQVQILNGFNDIKEDMGKLKLSFEGMKSRVSGIDKNLTDLTSRSDSTVNGLRNTLSDQGKAISILQQQISQFNVQVPSLVDEYSKLETNQKKISDNLSNHENRIKALEINDMNFLKSFEKQSKQIDALERKVNALPTAGGALSILSSTQTLWNAVKPDVDRDIKVESMKIMNELNTLSASSSRAISTLRVKVKTNTDFQRSLKALLNENVANLAKNITNTKKDIDQLYPTVDNLRKSIMALGDGQTSLRTNIITLNGTVAHLRVKIADIYDELKAKYDAMNDELEKMKKEDIGNIDNELKESRMKLETLKAAVDKIEMSMNTVSSNNKDMKKTIVEVKVGMENLANEIANQQTKIGELESKIAGKANGVSDVAQWWVFGIGMIALSAYTIYLGITKK